MNLNLSETYATYIINDKLIEILGLPKKFRGKKRNYQGYFSLIFKWVYKEKHDVKYIWYVVDRVYKSWKNLPRKITPGYFNTVFKSSKDHYDSDKVNLPYSASREELLECGHTVKTLPFHLLTTKERKQREEDISAEHVSNEDRKSFRGFLEKL
jgi:hypothetical protein